MSTSKMRKDPTWQQENGVVNLLRLLFESLFRPLLETLLHHIPVTVTRLRNISARCHHMRRRIHHSLPQTVLPELAPQTNPCHMRRRIHHSLPQTVQPELAHHTNPPTCQHFLLLPRSILRQHYLGNYPPSASCSFWIFCRSQSVT